ncbi:NAD(P)-dependent dehydrogenase (short-subunit alcohol dehydrogenase family) [Rhizobium laguerreae]|uniref:NAD(P)-dependent dehydrogenase (Short-subunit alcohol dehydrogenase family) n=1 Tax=Rhizobium laguerreae TaxID=1076926 RepID=A0ABR6GJ80_9HYPH|nr:NAD(P)-dependent dehydrogenase (short-subunit alcohol dehydrogenase family) [Rhizobium laguerreae]
MADRKRIALVTGGNKGIGLEIARQLAEAGNLVIIGSRSSVRGQTAVEDLRSCGLEAETIVIDMNDHAGIATAAQTIRLQHGHLDILINNAGMGDAEDGPPTSSPIEAVKRWTRTLWAPWQ